MNLELIAQSSQILGALFREDISNNAELINAIRSLDENEWPIELEDRDELTEAFNLLYIGLEADKLTSLHEEYNRLFIGPFALPCPPWGSVYLDKDGVIFGISTLDLRDWMRANGVSLDLKMNEPEDHIGLMLAMISELADDGREELLTELLEKHFLTWVYTYLERLEASSEHEFYTGLARLATATIKSW